VTGEELIRELFAPVETMAQFMRPNRRYADMTVADLLNVATSMATADNTTADMLAEIVVRARAAGLPTLTYLAEQLPFDKGGRR
jgi:hypothetical protein